MLSGGDGSAGDAIAVVEMAAAAAAAVGEGGIVAAGEGSADFSAACFFTSDFVVLVGVFGFFTEPEAVVAAGGSGGFGAAVVLAGFVFEVDRAVVIAALAAVGTAGFFVEEGFDEEREDGVAADGAADAVVVAAAFAAGGAFTVGFTSFVVATVGDAHCGFSARCHAFVCGEEVGVNAATGASWVEIEEGMGRAAAGDAALVDAVCAAGVAARDTAI